MPTLDSALSQGPSLKDVQGDHKRDFLSLSSSVHMWVKNQEVSTLRSTCPCVCPSQTAWWPLSLFSNPLPRILFYKSPDCPIPDLLYPLDISLWRQNTKRSYKGETLHNSKIPFVSSTFKPSVLLDDYPEVRLMDHVAVLFLIF